MSKGKVIRGPWRRRAPKGSKFAKHHEKHDKLMDQLRASIEQLKEAKRGR